MSVAPAATSVRLSQARASTTYSAALANQLAVYDGADRLVVAGEEPRGDQAVVGPRLCLARLQRDRHEVHRAIDAAGARVAGELRRRRAPGSRALLPTDPCACTAQSA